MPRGDQISRQWQILQILEARRMGVSVPDLANELEANARTIYRDIEALEMAGFPLYSEKKDGVGELVFRRRVWCQDSRAFRADRDHGAFASARSSQGI